MAMQYKTVGDIVEEMQQLQRRRAVYEDIASYLAQFISTDSTKPTRGIKSPVGDEEVVAESFIEEIRHEYLDKAFEIGKQIDRFLKQATSSKAVEAPKLKKIVRREAPKRRTNVKKNKGPSQKSK